MKAKSASDPDLPRLDARVSDVLTRWPALTAVFVRRRMACPGCAMADFMTLAEAAEAYQTDADELLAELHVALAS